jgi:anti-sigma factor RsiW
MSDTLMGCDAFEARLAEYLEGELDFAARRAMERHAAGCAQCTSLVADLERIRRDASALGPLAPSRDLWPEISARIEAPVVPLASRPAAAAAKRRWTASWMAAAAAVLVAATAGVTYSIVKRQNGQVPQVATAPTGGATAPTGKATGPGGPAAVQPVANKLQSAEVTYDREIDQLARILDERRGQLDTGTVRVIEKNLHVIDQAIADSRAALVRDPKSHFLNEQLNKTLDRKVELLRTIALLPSGT